MADETSAVVSSRVDSGENPFTAEGILSQKADYIISHSTITRTEIHIEDPDVQLDHPPSSPHHGDANQSDDVIEAVVSKPVHSTPEAVGPQSIEVEVSKGTASFAVPQKAEEVKLKKSKKCGNCCTVA